MATSFTLHSSMVRLCPPRASICPTLATSPTCKKTLQIKQKKIGTPEGLSLARTRTSRSHLLKAAAGSVDAFNQTAPLPHGPEEIIRELYRCINNKDMKALEHIISDDCCIEDFSLSKHFQQKKEIMKFFEELAACMGKSVKFAANTIEEGEDIAWVNWHLEWEDKQIPFTRGCSIFEFEKKEPHRLLIRKVVLSRRIITEVTRGELEKQEEEEHLRRQPKGK